MITVSGLTKTYGDRTVVDRVSFELEPGTVTGFLGPNGAGKTTTMRMITGLVPASAGQALVGGTPYASLPNPGAVMGTLLDAGAVHPGRTGRTHLRILAGTLGVDAERVDEVLELVGLTAAAGRRIASYSLGMRQRLGIAGALLADPPVLMFDEPANGLDPEGIRWMRDLLRGHAARGGTVLLSSHLLGEVDALADKLVIIGNGRIAAQGSRDELLAGAGTLVRARDTAALEAALAAAGVAAQRLEDGGFIVDAEPEAVGRAALEGAVALTHLGPSESAGLEQLFFDLTAGAPDAPPADLVEASR
jgi:ABC-2 type transport system ATP-binding protein